MPNIESMISAQRILCIKRYLSSDLAGWKICLDFYLKKPGGGGCFIVTLTISNYQQLFQNFTKNAL